ncbi:MAG: M48 family metalloprotease [Myxococcota bacterium]
MADDRVTVDCRHCGTTNRVPVERALEDLTKPSCGRCSGELFRARGEPLLDVEAEHLAHPWDREALERLRSVPYADKLLSRVLGSTLDKLSRFQFTAGALHVTDRQAPRLLRLYHEAAGRVNVDPPPLYIVQTPAVNAFTSGAGQPIVAVTSGLLDAMGERELVAVLGHELTHVKLGHVLYRTLAQLLVGGGLGLLGRFLGIAKLLAMPLQIALLRWYQMAELSADRGELLATGSLETCLRTHMLMAGGSARFVEDLDVDAFVEQAEEAERMRDGDLLVYVMEMMDNTRRTHPLPAWRVHHALKWAKGPDFLPLLAGPHRPILEDRAAG